MNLPSSFLSFYPQDKTKTSVSADTHFHKNPTHPLLENISSHKHIIQFEIIQMCCVTDAPTCHQILLILFWMATKGETLNVWNLDTAKSLNMTSILYTAHVCKPGNSVMLYNKGVAKSGWLKISYKNLKTRTDTAKSTETARSSPVGLPYVAAAVRTSNHSFQLTKSQHLRQILQHFKISAGSTYRQDPPRENNWTHIRHHMWQLRLRGTLHGWNNKGGKRLNEQWKQTSLD